MPFLPRRLYCVLSVDSCSGGVAVAGLAYGRPFTMTEPCKPAFIVCRLVLFAADLQKTVSRV